MLAADAGEATRLEEEIRFFLEGALPVLSFQDYETLPYDRFSAHPDIISARLRALAALPRLRRAVNDHNLPYADFLGVLRESAAAADVDLQVLESFGLPADFPLSPSYPQGQYLRFVVCALRR